MVRNVAGGAGALFLLGFGFVIGCFFSASCGSGVDSWATSDCECAASEVTYDNDDSSLGGNDVQDALDELDLKFRNHVETSSWTRAHGSSTSGPVTVAAGSGDVLVRSVTFTPNRPKDLILQVTAEGTTTLVGAAGAGDTMRLDLLDAAGTTIATQALAVSAGIDVPFRIAVAPLGAVSGIAYVNPSASYRVRIVAAAATGWTSNSIKFRIVVLQSPMVDDPSPDIVG